MAQIVDAEQVQAGWKERMENERADKERATALAAKSKTTLHMMLHRHNITHLMVYFTRYIHFFDYLLFFHYSRPHFCVRGSVGVDKCGRTATSLHNHVVYSRLCFVARHLSWFPNH